MARGVGCVGGDTVAAVATYREVQLAVGIGDG